MKTEILVIGAGAAGIRAALSAAAEGAQVLLACERPPGESGSSFYPASPSWGMMFAQDEQDAKKFEQEILRSAGPCVNPRLVERLAGESVRAREILRKEGVPFQDNASIGLTGCFGDHPRGGMLLDLEAVKRTWREELKAGVKVCSGLQCVALLGEEGCICGAAFLDKQGETVFIQAKAVVLATGGVNGLYERGFQYGRLFGDAYAMAARHGAPVVNLEFVQFIPGTLSPRKGVNFYHFALKTLPELLDAAGQPFLVEYLPEGCTVEECLRQRAGHGPYSMEDQGRWFDLAIARHCPEGAAVVFAPHALEGSWCDPWRRCLKTMGEGLDTVFRVYPFCQACNGGIQLKDDLSTALPGLFACGEASGGMHGSNRMGGNAVLATQVFGRLAGQKAAQYAKGVPAVSLTETEMHRKLAEEWKTDAAPRETMEQTLKLLRQTMQRNAFLQRTEAGLTEALQTVRQLTFSPLRAEKSERAEAFAVRNALDAAQLMLRAMLNRRESRGGHFRLDAPDKDESFSCMMPVFLQD